MKLFVTKDCKECTDVLNIVTREKKDVEIIELHKKDGKYYSRADDGEALIDIDATPTLYIERAGNEGVLLSGKEGIIDVLTKGYLHKVKICPYISAPCKEKDCELFNIIMNNNIPEGKCSQAWSSIFMLDFITGMNKYIMRVDEIFDKINSVKEE